MQPTKTLRFLLVTATAIEFVIGAACAVALVRSTKRAGGAVSSAGSTKRLGRVGEVA